MASAHSGLPSLDSLLRKCGSFERENSAFSSRFELNRLEKDVEMDGLPEGQDVQSTLRIALAVAVLHTKPVDLTISEYCEQLRQKAITKAMQLYQQKQILNGEVIRLKEQILTQLNSGQLSLADPAVKGSCPFTDGDSSVFLTPPSTLGETSALEHQQQSLVTSSGNSFYVTLLDACLTCSSICVSPKPDAILVLLNSLNFLVGHPRTPAFVDPIHRGILEDMVIKTLLRLDHQLPAIPTIDLKEFFHRWIACFILDGDRTACRRIAAPVEHSVSLLLRLTSGQFLRAAILEVVTSHLTQLTLTNILTSKCPEVLNVFAYESAAILLLLMERLLATTSGRHDEQWQLMLGHCLGRLRLQFPLLVSRICDLTCRLESI